MTSSLLSGLIAYWSLDEQSGIRYSHNGLNDLTDNNTVTGAPGKVGMACGFTSSNSESLSHADNVDLSTGDIDVALIAWIYLDTKSSVMTIASKWGGSSDEYQLTYVSTSDRLAFNFANSVTATANSFGNVPTGTWIFVVAWYDAAANTVNIQINNGATDSASLSGGATDGSSQFYIGSMTGVGQFWNGRIDSIGFWKRILTQREIALLYNNGNGLAYPFVSPPRFAFRRNRIIGQLTNLRQPM